MRFNNTLILASLAISVAAIPGLGSKKYFCETSAGKFQIKEDWAKAAAAAARIAAAAIVATDGFPHAFRGMSGFVENSPGQSKSNTQLKFYGGVNPKCNENNPMLSEYPVMKDKSLFRGRVNGHSLTPARIIFVPETGELCGVVTHFIESADHVGSGPFRVCDLA